MIRTSVWTSKRRAGNPVDCRSALRRSKFVWLVVSEAEQEVNASFVGVGVGVEGLLGEGSW